MLIRAEQIFAGVEAAKELVLVLKLNIQQSIRPSLENFRFVLSSSLLVGNLSGKLPAILVGASDVNNYLVNIQRWGDASCITEMKCKNNVGLFVIFSPISNGITIIENVNSSSYPIVPHDFK